MSSPIFFRSFIGMSGQTISLAMMKGLDILPFTAITSSLTMRLAFSKSAFAFWEVPFMKMILYSPVSSSMTTIMFPFLVTILFRTIPITVTSRPLAQLLSASMFGTIPGMPILWPPIMSRIFSMPVPESTRRSRRGSRRPIRSP